MVWIGRPVGFDLGRIISENVVRRVEIPVVTSGMTFSVHVLKVESWKLKADIWKVERWKLKKLKVERALSE